MTRRRRVPILPIVTPGWRESKTFDALHSALPDLEPFELVGHLTLFAEAVFAFRPKGNVSGWTDDVIHDVAGWRSTTASFAAALRATGWVSETGDVLWWGQGSGAVIRRRRRDAARKRRERAEARTAKTGQRVEPSARACAREGPAGLPLAGQRSDARPPANRVPRTEAQALPLPGASARDGVRPAVIRWRRNRLG